jgi:hypothetical protein
MLGQHGRHCQEAKLQNPTARKRLPAGRQPHWNTIIASRDHLGYVRKVEARAGRWLLRRRRNGRYSTEPLGTADDYQQADGITVLDYQQARAKAVERSMDETRPAGRLTVQRAIVDYITYLEASGKNTATGGRVLDITQAGSSRGRVVDLPADQTVGGVDGGRFKWL